MVTKKRRRSQLARLGAERRQLRRSRLAARRRRQRIVATVVLVVLLLSALTAWVVLHDGDAGAARAVGVDYPGVADLSRHPATTTGGAR